MISRRGFVAGMVAAIAGFNRHGFAASLSTPEPPRLLRSYKVMTGDFRISRETLAKVQAEEGAFVKWAEKAVADANRRSMAEVLRMYGA